MIKMKGLDFLLIFLFLIFAVIGFLMGYTTSCVFIQVESTQPAKVVYGNITAIYLHLDLEHKTAYYSYNILLGDGTNITFDSQNKVFELGDFVTVVLNSRGEPIEVYKEFYMIKVNNK